MRAFLALAFLVGLMSSVPVASLAADPSSTAGTREGILVGWPAEEGWAIAHRQDTQQIQLIELLRKGESLDNWVQIGSILSAKGVQFAHIQMAYEKLATEFRRTCPDATLAIYLIEPAIEFPRVIYSQECSKTPQDGRPEATVVLVVQGRQSLYIVQRALRARALPDDLRANWLEWLKTARVEYR